MKKANTSILSYDAAEFCTMPLLWLVWLFCSFARDGGRVGASPELALSGRSLDVAAFVHCHILSKS